MRDYFEHGLATYPALHFQPIAALAGVQSIALHYHSVEDRQAIEVMELDPRRQVRRVTVHYTAPAARGPAVSVATTHATDKS